MLRAIMFIYAPIAVVYYAFADNIPLKDLALYMTMLSTFLIVSFMCFAMPYTSGVVVRSEGDPLPSKKAKFGKWFKERFLIFVSLVFVLESIVLVGWSFAKGFQ